MIWLLANAFNGIQVWYNRRTFGKIDLIPVDSTVVPVCPTVINVVSNATPVNISPITSVV